MTWMGFFFGSDRPSPARKALVSCVLATVGCAFYGFGNDFVPSSSWADLGMYLSVAAGLLATVATFVGYKSGWYVNSGRSRGFILFSTLIAGSLLTWLALVHGFGSLVTTVVGERYVAAASLKKKQGHSRRGLCNFRLTGEALERAFPDYLCISEAEFAAIPEQVTVDLEGRLSSFGFAIRNSSIANSQTR